MRRVPKEPMSARQTVGTHVMNSLGGKKILVVEYQPLVAADIEDRLLEAGATKVTIVSRPVQRIDLSGYDALIINATQDRNLAQQLTSGADHPSCAVVVLHDETARARDLFPNAEIVEIPFDSVAINDALTKAFSSRRSISV